MKKIIFLSGILMFSVSLLGAANTIEGNLDLNTMNLKILNDVEQANHVIEVEETFFGWYTGRCRDGHTFSFQANSREAAKGYVNGYCAARSECETSDCDA